MFSQFYSDEMLRKLPTDNLEADEMMLTALEDAVGRGTNNETIKELVKAVEVYEAFRSSRGMVYVEPQWTAHPSNNRNIAANIVTAAREEHNQEATKQTAKSTFQQSAEFFKMQSGAMFCYDFPADDIEKLQNWLNELRALIIKAEQLSEDHRARLLKRLEQLQTELHKKLSDLDRFWGLVGDAGVVIHKFGEDTKAVRRLIYAITAIIVKVQSLAHGLPAPTVHPLLPSPEDFQDEDLRV